MRAVGIIFAVAAALAFQQTILTRYVRGTVALDLVLVAVVYVALTSGPVAGLWTGTFAGLLQDRGVIDADVAAASEQRARAEIEAAVVWAETQPEPACEDVAEGVYAE